MKRIFVLALAVFLIGCALNAIAHNAKVSYVETDEMNTHDTDEDTLSEKGRSHDFLEINYFGYNADVRLTERHELHYGSVFYPIDSLSMRHNVSHSFVIDLETNDTTRVDMRKHCYAMLSYKPLVIVDVFEVDFDGHTYVVHELSDERTRANDIDSDEEKFGPSRDCFQIR